VNSQFGCCPASGKPSIPAQPYRSKTAPTSAALGKPHHHGAFGVVRAASSAKEHCLDSPFGKLVRNLTSQRTIPLPLLLGVAVPLLDLPLRLIDKFVEEGTLRAEADADKFVAVLAILSEETMAITGPEP